jgi:hypothetical protein
MAVASHHVDPSMERISIAHKCHLSVWNGAGRSIVGRIVAYSDGDNGPYRGSIVTLGGSSRDRQVIEASVGDRAGVYYRRIRLNGRAEWTLMISTWYLIVPSAAGVIVCCGIRIYRKYRAKWEEKQCQDEKR